MERVKLDDSPGFYKILMLHTSIKDAIGTLPIKAVDARALPKVDYLALAHLHVNYCRDGCVYSGPIFPNNVSELEELKNGFFYIVENGKARKEELKLKSVLVLDVEITESVNATDKILSTLQRESVDGKIVIVKLYGMLKEGKIADIDFRKIESYLKERKAYVFLKSTTKLHMAEPEVKVDSIESSSIESEIIKKFEDKNPSRFNYLASLLTRSLQIEKQEDEKKLNFEGRVMSEVKKILPL